MKKIGKIFYVVVPLAVMLLFLNAIIGKNISYEDRYTSFSSGWNFYLNGEDKGIHDLPYNLKCKKGDTVKITKMIDKDFKYKTLMYLSSYQSLKVRIDNQIIYSFDTSLNSKPAKSLGYFWQFIDMEDSYKGKEIEIEISSPYLSKCGKVEPIYVGNSSSLVEMLFDKYWGEIVIALFIIFFSFICLFLVLYFKDNIRKKKGLLYLALLSFLGGMWIFADSNLWQFFSANITLGYMLTYVSLYLMPVTVCLYAKNSYNIKHTEFADFLIIINLLFVVATIALQIFGIFDFKETLPIFQCFALFTIVSFCIICYKEMRVNTDIKFFLLSVILFGAAGVINLIILLFSFFNRPTYIFQIGFFAFLIFQMANMIKSFNAYSKIKNTNKILTQLAYNDELTGLQNRTAYQRRLDMLNEKWDQYANIMAVVMDLNNLKKANDTYGHSMGDILIKTAGEYIGEAFMPECEVYRIGGDEFVAICENATKEKSNDFLKNLKKLTLRYNITNPTIKLEIATGCCFVDKSKDNCIEDLIARCDERMYQNKAELKNKSKVG